MLSPPSPQQFSRLERILELVTEHERVYREQDIRLADLVQKVTELDVRCTTETAPLLPLKERNVAMELDLARAAMETVVRQLAAVSKTNQALQAELRNCQQKQAAQQLSYESTIAVLQADLAAVRSRVDDVQANTQAGLDQLRASARVQVEQQRFETQEQLQSTQRELESKVSQAVQEVRTQAAASVRELEAWTKQEMLQLAAKLKAVVQSCSNHQQQVNLQMEALQQQWDNTSAAMEALQQEDKRSRKHITRLQQQTEELQNACRTTAATATAVDQLQQEVQDLAQSQQQLRAQTDVCHSSASSSSRKLQEVAQQLQQLDDRVAGQTSDLTGLAEAVLGCLGAARQHAAAAAAAAATQPPSSYLSNLLGPAVPPAPPVAPAASKQQWAAWDEQLMQVDGLVARLRRQQRAAEFSGSAAHALLGSPARQSFTPRSTHSTSSPVALGALLGRS